MQFKQKNPAVFSDTKKNENSALWYGGVKAAIWRGLWSWPRDRVSQRYEPKASAICTANQSVLY